MRIISKDNRERITQCKYCNTKIAYKNEDVFLGMWAIKQIQCPVCKQSIKISVFDRRV